MSKASLVTAFLLASLLGPTVARSAEFHPPTMIDAIRAGTGYTIPASWSGIWTTLDSTYTCSPRVLTSTDTYTDTLCTGESFEPDTTGGFNYQCTGTVTETEVHLTCTGSFDFEGCTITFTSVMDGTRTADTAISTTTMTTTYSPPMCVFLPDSCQVIVARTSRIAPQPGTCTTPTQQGTWGQLKVRYR